MDDIEREIKNLDKTHNSVLFISHYNSKFLISDEIIILLTKKFKEGLYLNFYYPSSTLIRRIGKEHTKKISFIDCISDEKNSGVRKKDIKLKKDSTINDVIKIIDEKIHDGEHNFLYCDSIETVFDRFGEKDALKFLDYLSEKMKTHETFLIASTLEIPKDEHIIKDVSKIFKHKVFLGL